MRVERPTGALDSLELATCREDAERFVWMCENWAYAHGIIFFDGFDLGPLTPLREAIDGRRYSEKEPK